MHPKRNDDATVKLRAYDAQGEIVDTMDTFGKLAPELQYLDFADKARREYKAIRIVMEVAYAIMLCIFLSSGVEAHGNESYKGSCGGFNCNPFVGYSIDITLERSFPEEAVAPIPYAGLNISHYLDDWYGMMVYQLMIDERSVVKLNDDWWSLLSPLGQAMILLGLVLLISGVLWWTDNQLHKQLEIGKE